MMTMMKSLLAFSALAASTSAFQRVSVPSTTRSVARPMPSSLSALIYGWDGQPESADETFSSGSTGGVSYFDVGSDMGQSCSPVGTAVAEALSYDRERAGHLARLAVAFSPPERALTLQDIENVEVICVHDTSIEIQAIVCEDGGCVSLSVPVTFPRSCYHEDPQLEGCVMQNIDELDAQAGTVIQQQQLSQAQEDDPELCRLDEKFEAFPGWWVPPECYANLAGDCETVRQLLNEAEFQPDITALAQDALRRIEAGENYSVLQAKVAIVGPAGLCFKVRAQHEGTGSMHVMDVVHPFDTTHDNVDSLRAAVLGAVAAAEGN